MKRRDDATAHDFTLVYELGRDMGCRTMLCADRQTASEPMLRLTRSRADHE